MSRVQKFHKYFWRSNQAYVNWQQPPSSHRSTLSFRFYNPSTNSFACLVPDTYIKQKTLSLSLAFLEKNSKGVNMQLNSVLNLNRVFCFKIWQDYFLYAPSPPLPPWHCVCPPPLIMVLLLLRWCVKPIIATVVTIPIKCALPPPIARPLVWCWHLTIAVLSLRCLFFSN